MGRRGRKSRAALAIIPASHQRPEPPAGMDEEEAEEWRAIVTQMPGDWFPRETHALLAQYCGAVVSARRLTKARHKLEKARGFDLDKYERVSKLLGREVALIATLATKMRLSQHASYDPKKRKASGPRVPPPWEE